MTHAWTPIPLAALLYHLCDGNFDNVAKSSCIRYLDRPVALNLPFGYFVALFSVV